MCQDKDLCLNILLTMVTDLTVKREYDLFQVLKDRSSLSKLILIFLNFIMPYLKYLKYFQYHMQT